MRHARLRVGLGVGRHVSDPPQQTSALLELLADSQIPFVVIGGVAAISWGSSQFTRDLDIAIEFTTANLTRLLEVLAPHRPRHLTRPDLPGIAESPGELTKFRSLLLNTALGRIDVLRDVPPLGTYADFAGRGTQAVVHGRELTVIALDDLIAIKEHVARPKDLLVAHELRAVRSRIRS